MRILVAWYSRTGTTAAVVQATRPLLEAAGHEVADARIIARRDFPYPAWLALSFVPEARMPLAGRYPDPSAFDACLLAVPKWTVSCPPVLQYLARFGRRLPPTAIALTYGGFDEGRYLLALEGRLRRLGVAHLGSTLVRRRHVEDASFEHALSHFLVAAFPSRLSEPERREPEPREPERREPERREP